MKYRKRTLKQKRAILKKFYQNDKDYGKTARETNVAVSLLMYWLADEDINPDKEYAEEVRSRLTAKRKPAKDPLPDGVKMASISNPDELLKENRDLRKKIAYLEDKVAYLTELYNVISEDPEKTSKKNGSSHWKDSSRQITEI